MNKNFKDLFQHCQPQDNNCWKKEFSKLIKCNNDDIECWRRQLPDFPCSLQDIDCWKNQIPDLPCESMDYQCLKNKLPDLPCKILDMICWQRYVKNWTPEGVRKTDEGVVPRAQHRPLNWLYTMDAASRHQG